MLDVESITPNGVSSDHYRELARRMRGSGLLDKQPRYYTILFSVVTLLLIAAWTLFAFTKNPALLVLNAVFLGCISVQLGFLMHDAGHVEIFSKRWKNDLVGFLAGDLFGGICYGWWAPHHNEHHSSPNHVMDDPDLPMIRIAFALSEEEARQTRGIRRLVVKFQAYLLPVVFLFQSFVLKCYGFSFLIRKRSPHRFLEIFLLTVHHVFYFWFLYHFLGLKYAAMVALIHHVVGGFYLTTLLAPNHIGRPLVEPQSNPDPLRSQVEPSRNVVTPEALDFLWGGLNHQIEHHLFPTMSRNKTRAAIPIARSYCKEIGVPYHEVSFIGTYREIFGFLHEISMATRGDRLPPQPAAVGSAGRDSSR